MPNAKLVGLEWVWGLLQSNLASSGEPPASQNQSINFSVFWNTNSVMQILYQ